MKPIYWVGYTLSGLIAKLAFQVKVYGRENFIEEGPAIFASNHQSYLDPPLVGSCCREELHYLMRDTLLRVPVLGRILPRLNTVPVDRARGDVGALRAVISLVKAGHRVIIFPEGTRSMDGKLQKARAGLGMIIAKTRVPVVPVRIFGSYEALPKKGGLKFAPITVVVGKPMRFAESDFARNDRNLYQELSDRVMAEIAKLENPRAK